MHNYILFNKNSMIEYSLPATFAGRDTIISASKSPMYYR